MAEQIIVRNLREDDRVVLWERDDEHPDGEAWIAGKGWIGRVGQTARVRQRIHERQLIEATEEELAAFERERDERAREAAMKRAEEAAVGLRDSEASLEQQLRRVRKQMAQLSALVQAGDAAAAAPAPAGEVAAVAAPAPKAGK